MKKFATLLALVAVTGAIFAGCSKGEDAGGDKGGAAAPATDKK